MLLAPSFLKCLSPEDRASLGKGGLLPEEALAKAEVRSERDLHKLVRALLGLKGIEFIESRMDKRTTQKKGVPDFIFAIKGNETIGEDGALNGSDAYAVAWECKTDKGQLSIEQQQAHVRMSKPPNCWHIRVIKSLPEAINELKELGL